MNGPGLSTMIIENRATLGSRSQILTEIAMYLSKMDRKDSSLAWWRLMKAIDVVWLGQLVAYYTPKHWA